MKLFKQILFGLGIYLAVMLFFGMFAALNHIQNGKIGKINCDRFHVVEIVVPVVPIGCLLSKQVYP